MGVCEEIFILDLIAIKSFVVSGLGQVPDTTPYLWFWDFQICIGLFFPRDEIYFIGSGYNFPCRDFC